MGQRAPFLQATAHIAHVLWVCKPIRKEAPMQSRHGPASASVISPEGVGEQAAGPALTRPLAKVPSLFSGLTSPLK